MYVRLAFAVAAHLEPEILIVDEVLAVGDAAFQKKCLGKMEDVAEKEGRTVLFVSHNMAAIDKLCTHGISLNQGKVGYIGNQTGAITHYLTNVSGKNCLLKDRLDREGTGEIKVIGIEFRDIDGNIIEAATSGQDVDVYLHFEAGNWKNNFPVVVGLSCKTQLDIPVFLQASQLDEKIFNQLPNSGTFICRIHKLPLPVSSYRIAYGINLYQDGKCIDAIQDAIELTVIEGDFFGSGILPPFSHGVCLVEASWLLT